MNKSVLIGVGALLVIVGLLWGAQGLNLVGGSPMSGKTLWAVVGPLVALAGAAMVATGLRGRTR